MREYSFLCIPVSLRALFISAIVMDFIFFPNVVLLISALFALIKWVPTKDYSKPSVVVYIWLKLILSILIALSMWAPFGINARNLSNVNGYCYIMEEEGVEECEEDNRQYIAGVVCTVILIVFYTVNSVVAAQLFYALKVWNQNSIPTADNYPIEDEPVQVVYVPRPLEDFPITESQPFSQHTFAVLPPAASAVYRNSQLKF